MSIQSNELQVVDHLYSLSAVIVQGATLNQSLDHIYESFHDLIPYDRMGFADIDNERQIATARWARSNDRLLLRVGFSAPLACSSLSFVLERRQPRVLNDLPRYLEVRPASRSTALIVREGFKSSMTCPLYVDDIPTGILFFTSKERDTFTHYHVRIMEELAMQLALLLKVSRITADQHNMASARMTHREPIELTLSQLKAGMVLAEPLKIGSGTLLLAAGTRLTSQAIKRLVVLQQKGSADLSFVKIL